MKNWFRIQRLESPTRQFLALAVLVIGFLIFRFQIAIGPLAGISELTGRGWLSWAFLLAGFLALCLQFLGRQVKILCLLPLVLFLWLILSYLYPAATLTRNSTLAREPVSDFQLIRLFIFWISWWLAPLLDLVLKHCVVVLEKYHTGSSFVDKGVLYLRLLDPQRANSSSLTQLIRLPIRAQRYFAYGDRVWVLRAEKTPVLIKIGKVGSFETWPILKPN